MKTTSTLDILSQVNAALAHCKPGDAVTGELQKLAAKLEQDIRTQKAASAGSLSATRTITAMLNDLKKHDGRTAIHYQWRDAQNRQCVCDGFIAFRLTEPLPLEERPKDAGTPIELEKVFPQSLREYKRVELPDAKTLKASIDIERAKFTGKRKEFAPLHDLGYCLPIVRADYLLKVLAVLGDDAEAYYKSVNYPLYIKAANGDGMLCPVNSKAKNAELAKANEDAGKAAHELIRRLNEYRERAEIEPEYALTPDEFAALVELMPA